MYMHLAYLYVHTSHEHERSIRILSLLQIHKQMGYHNFKKRSHWRAEYVHSTCTPLGKHKAYDDLLDIRTLTMPYGQYLGRKCAPFKFPTTNVSRGYD